MYINVNVNVLYNPGLQHDMIVLNFLRRNHPLRVFETVKVANHAARLRSQINSPQVPGSSPTSLRSSRISTPRTSYYESDNISVNMEDKHFPLTHTQDHGSVSVYFQLFTKMTDC